MTDPTDEASRQRDAENPAGAPGQQDAAAQGGPFALLPGDGAYVDRLFAEFGAQAVELESIGGGAVRLLGFEHEGYLTVATLGLHRVPLDEGEPAELTCDADLDTVGAAVVTLRVAAEHVVVSRRALVPGRVLVNEVPYLEGSTISGLVALDEGEASAVRSADGQVAGRLHRVVMLTNVEARYVAAYGLDALPERADAAALRNPERPDLVSVDDLPIPDVPVIVSRMLDDQPARWVEVDYAGRYVALTMAESDAFLDDPANLDVWPLARLVERNPGLREFAVSAVPGDCIRYSDDDGWVAARQDGFLE
ncbi:suppressor of fused domain protein [Nigerium massiliense]|uniref:suppressor of fused domain protein n=1 Tax=Nigerium massiliense TaxID=1522317 RepID=UPI00058F9AAA|nr:suppressor of fused domain protein [Nigerium massiliense]